jgi:hypothetical protein
MAKTWPGTVRSPTERQQRGMPAIFSGLRASIMLHKVGRHRGRGLARPSKAALTDNEWQGMIRRSEHPTIGAPDFILLILEDHLGECATKTTRYRTASESRPARVCLETISCRQAVCASPVCVTGPVRSGTPVAGRTLAVPTDRSLACFLAHLPETRLSLARFCASDRASFLAALAASCFPSLADFVDYFNGESEQVVLEDVSGVPWYSFRPELVRLSLLVPFSA